MFLLTVNSSAAALHAAINLLSGCNDHNIAEFPDLNLDGPEAKAGQEDLDGTDPLLMPTNEADPESLPCETNKSNPNTTFTDACDIMSGTLGHMTQSHLPLPDIDTPQHGQDASTQETEQAEEGHHRMEEAPICLDETESMSHPPVGLTEKPEKVADMTMAVEKDNIAQETALTKGLVYLIRPRRILAEHSSSSSIGHGIIRLDPRWHGRDDLLKKVRIKYVSSYQEVVSVLANIHLLHEAEEEGVRGVVLDHLSDIVGASRLKHQEAICLSMSIPGVELVVVTASPGCEAVPVVVPFASRGALSLNV